MPYNFFEDLKKSAHSILDPKQSSVDSKRLRKEIPKVQRLIQTAQQDVKQAERMKENALKNRNDQEGVVNALVEDLKNMSPNDSVRSQLVNQKAGAEIGLIPLQRTLEVAQKNLDEKKTKLMHAETQLKRLQEKLNTTDERSETNGTLLTPKK